MESRPWSVLACSVRGCGAPLEQRERTFACPRGHAFDVARAGHLNLLQPQDRRSLSAGDAREAVRARRALRARGLGPGLSAALADLAASASFARGAVALDLGCGPGDHLAEVAARAGLAALGVDLSAAAVEAAARAHPQCAWVVANADRRLPILDASVDLLLSVDGRRPAAEMARVLGPDGAVLVAVPAPDDLTELRAACLGEVRPLRGLDAVLEELAGPFELAARTSVRETAALDAAGLLDLARATYRLARASQRERLAGLERLTVTAVHDVGLFRRAGRAR